MHIDQAHKSTTNRYKHQTNAIQKTISEINNDEDCWKSVEDERENDQYVT
jgi:hypothetical protein